MQIYFFTKGSFVELNVCFSKIDLNPPPKLWGNESLKILRTPKLGDLSLGLDLAQKLQLTGWQGTEEVGKPKTSGDLTLNIWSCQQHKREKQTLKSLQMRAKTMEELWPKKTPSEPNQGFRCHFQLSNFQEIEELGRGRRLCSTKPQGCSQYDPEWRKPKKDISSIKNFKEQKMQVDPQDFFWKRLLYKVDPLWIPIPITCEETAWHSCDSWWLEYLYLMMFWGYFNFLGVVKRNLYLLQRHAEILRD